MKNFSKSLRVILATTFIFIVAAGAVFTVFANQNPDKVVITITPEFTEYPVSATLDVKIKYTISIKPPEGEYLGFFQFKLLPSDGLTLATNEDAESGYFINKENIYDDVSGDGIYLAFEYNPETAGIFATGTIPPNINDALVPRVQYDEIEIMSIVATVPAGSEGVYTLSVSETVQDLVAGMSAVSQYSLDDIEVVTTPVSVSADAGYNIVGRISTGDNSRDIEVSLLGAGTNNVVATQTLTNGERKFTFTNVANGSYDILVTKTSALPLLIQGVTVLDANVDYTAIGSGYESFALKDGDANGDGFINFSDLDIVRSGKNYNTVVATGVDNPIDVNGDGYINFSDLDIIRSGSNYNKYADQTLNAVIITIN